MEQLVEPTNLQKKKPQIQRILGTYDQGKAGTNLICFCSIHGNEPAGKIAFVRVLETLNQMNPEFKGRMVGIMGNVVASTEHKRFIDIDLNRAWTEKRVNLLQESFDDFPEDLAEDIEQKYLWKVIHEEIGKETSSTVFLDLHTTSSKSQPFISINDTLRNRFFAGKYPAPIILGMEEYLDGTILSYINELGHIAIGVEGGQHDALTTIENHESIIWATLVFANCVNINEIPAIKCHQKKLARNTTDCNKLFEIRYRHEVKKGATFSMEPDYINFQFIRKNQLLAHELGNPVKATQNGRIFMPLYQKLGNDG